MKKTVFIKGAPVLSIAKPTELFKKKREVIKPIKTGKASNMIDVNEIKNYPKRYIDYSWLKSAAKVYNISSDIRDYVIVPVPSVTSDIPNRNTQAFELKDLLSFDTLSGRMLYQTFIAKPTYVDHDNQVPAKAKGVNLDVSIIHVNKYGLAKIVNLAAFDRTKDKDLVNDILKGRTGYSMGALASHFKCSICEGVLGPAVKRSCICNGTDFNDLQSLGKIIKGKLHYHIAKDFRFFELSNVDMPADVTATSDIYL